MRRSIFLMIGLILAVHGLSQSQNPTEVYLFDLERDNMSITLSNPENISNNKGYDNQPSFLPDGSGVLYSSTRHVQTDVVLYNIEGGTKQWLTDTEASEYSPTVMPGGDYFSTIVLENDGTQLLWKYPLDGSGEPKVVVDELVVGYHTWFDANTLYSFVLGDPPTLQRSEINEQLNTVVADQPGRSLHSIPNSDLISYVDKSDSTQWSITSLDPATDKSNSLTPTLNNSTEDMAWTPGGFILMGEGPKLYANKPAKETGWYEIADLSKYELTGISRIAVSPNSQKIAIVVKE